MKARRASFSLSLLATGDRMHRDLELRLGRARHRADSYYLGFDPGIDPLDESRSKTRRVLAALLDAAAVSLEKARAGAIVMLPYDFSDQYIGLLRVAVDAKGQAIEISRVTSTFEGWAIAPSVAGHIGEASWRDLKPWPLTADGASFAMTRSDLVADLRRSEAAALRFAKTKPTKPKTSKTSKTKRTTKAG